jgi:hypothetical protein
MIKSAAPECPFLLLHPCDIIITTVICLIATTEWRQGPANSLGSPCRKCTNVIVLSVCVFAVPSMHSWSAFVVINTFQQWMSWLPHRWRTQRVAIRNANCETLWIIKTLNAHCAPGIPGSMSVRVSVKLYHSSILGTWMVFGVCGAFTWHGLTWVAFLANHLLVSWFFPHGVWPERYENLAGLGGVVGGCGRVQILVPSWN